jgi:hypothetical protein
MFRRSFFCVALLGALAALATPTESQADFKVKIEAYGKDGSGNYTVSKGSTTLTDGDSDGSISLSNTNLFALGSGATTGLNLSVVATSNRTESNASPAQIQDVTATVRNRTNQDLKLVVTVTDTGFTIPNGPNPMTMISTLGTSGTSGFGATGTFQSGVDVDNQEFAMDAATSTQAIGFPVASSEQTRSLQFNRSGAYSMTNQFVLYLPNSMGNAASLTGTTEVYAAPAPSGLVALVTAVPFFGLLRRRMSRKEATAA